MKSPFKFLDSYTREDREIFFGREREIEELYRRVFDSRIMLVYGVSGTGKSSLIHCGLANKFQETDWLPLVIRRGSNVIDSMAAAIVEASLTQQSAEIQTALQFKKAIRSLYLDHYKPVFFIFDQFEEHFIFGNKNEDENFIKILKVLLSADIQCKFIFILREEYLGWLSTFERSIGGFFDNRVRVEKMDIGNARKSIEGPCRVFNIDIEEGFAGKMLEKLCPPEESEIELTYLQVYLDKIFKIASEDDSHEGKNITFHINDLDKAGNVYDILGSFLDEQISSYPDPEVVMLVLKAFVSAKGTKRPADAAEVREYALATGKDIDEQTINDLLISLVNLRILQDKDNTGRNELKHDALAAKIFEKITILEKELIEIRQLIENAYHNWQKRGVLLSSDDLHYIAPYESRLYLPEAYDNLVEKSKNELVMARHRRRNIFSAAAVLLIIILCAFTLWAIRERNNAVEKEKIANQEKLKASASEEAAIKARDNAIESDLKAVSSAQDALKARDAAKESELKALIEKKIAEHREMQARANNYNFLSKEVAAEDPTIALRLGMYALSLDAGNKAIKDNLNRIYYDNTFYKLYSKNPEGVLTFVSPDWTKIVTCAGRTARLTLSEGKETHLLIGHLINVIVLNSVHQISRKGFDDITSVAYSPDGKFILTGAMDRSARLWDIEGNQVQTFNGHLHYIKSVVFSPDGKKILTGSSDKTAKLWDLGGNCLKTFTGHKMDVFSVAFSPDGQNILTGSADSTAILWDLAGNQLQQFKGHSGYVTQAVFSPDGKTILTGSLDKTARLWDLKGNVLQIFSGHSQGINSIAFSSDGKTILTGSSDLTARLWDPDGNTLQVFRGHTGYISSVCFSPDGNKILTCSEDGTSRTWDISSIAIKSLKGHKSSIFTSVFSNDGKTILTLAADRTLKIWDSDGNNLKTIPALSNALALSPDGKTILIGLLAAQTMDFSGKTITTFSGHSQGIRSAVFSPDGKTLLTGSIDKTARLWDIRGNVIQIFTGHTQSIYSVAFSPDGKMILTGSGDQTARIWDLKGKTLKTLNGHTSGITSVTFSPDGKTILTGSVDKSARLWDTSGNCIQVFNGHTDALSSACFSPDGKNILTGSYDKTVRLWDLNGNILQIISGFKTAVYSVSISPDGKTILAGSGDSYSRLIPVKKTFLTFLNEKDSEELNIEQELKYGMIKPADLKEEKDVTRLKDALGYCLSQAKSQKEMKAGYTSLSLAIFKKLYNPITPSTDKKTLIVNGIELLKLQPGPYISERIEKAGQLFLEASRKDELREAYDFYSYRCSFMDSVKIILNIPENFMQISGKLMIADTACRHTIATDLSELSWSLVQFRQYKASLEAIDLAIRADSANPHIYMTYPLVLLLNDHTSEAIELYLRYRKEYMFKNLYKSYQTIYLEDIAELEKMGIKHPDFARIREILSK